MACHLFSSNLWSKPILTKHMEDSIEQVSMKIVRKLRHFYRKNIGWGKWLVVWWHQTITRTNADFVNWTLRNLWILNQNTCTCHLQNIRHFVQTSMGPGTLFNIKPAFPGMGIPIIKIRWSWDHLIFMMGIPIYIETGPWWCKYASSQLIISLVGLLPCSTSSGTRFKPVLTYLQLDYRKSISLNFPSLSQKETYAEMSSANVLSSCPWAMS